MPHFTAIQRLPPSAPSRLSLYFLYFNFIAFGRGNFLVLSCSFPRTVMHFTSVRVFAIGASFNQRNDFVSLLPVQREGQDRRTAPQQCASALWLGELLHGWASPCLAMTLSFRPLLRPSPPLCCGRALFASVCHSSPGRGTPGVCRSPPVPGVYRSPSPSPRFPESVRLRVPHSLPHGMGAAAESLRGFGPPPRPHHPCVRTPPCQGLPEPSRWAGGIGGVE